jgi:hypothetical protein
MKAHSASVTLYHMVPGHHREASVWHDADHKAEVIGSTPGIFISQRWVTPADWVALRPANDLPNGGGEYVNIYWSETSPEELAANFKQLGDDLTKVGRMDTVKYMQLVWPLPSHGRLRPVSVQARPGLEISPAAVTASTANTGLMTLIGEVTDPNQAGAFARWHEAEFMPLMLDTDLFTGAAKLALDGTGQDITLYYTDLDDPRRVYEEANAAMDSWAGFPGGDTVYRTTFSSMARPSIGHYDFYE